MSKKAVCLLSGGIDSCVSACIAKNLGYELYALTFNYNQRHKKEIDCSKKIAQNLGVKKHVIFDLNFEKIGRSSLTDLKIKPERDNPIEDIGKKIPSTYVPSRNTIFLSIGLAYAETLDADAIFIGVTSADYSGYPDCRPEYIASFQKLADLATKKSIESSKILIKAPLLHMKKFEIINKGNDLHAPLDITWSCYYGRRYACGRCDSCLLRLKGFKDIGMIDPIRYEDTH
jgi:7-cyano-7-deazaguanine synthase